MFCFLLLNQPSPSILFYFLFWVEKIDKRNFTVFCAILDLMRTRLWNSCTANQIFFSRSASVATFGEFLKTVYFGKKNSRIKKLKVYFKLAEVENYKSKLEKTPTPIIWIFLIYLFTKKNHEKPPLFKVYFYFF